jgi:putative membrane protein
MTTLHEEQHAGESEPDYRFTLANERTFLAWIRTALGLLAGGVAVHQLVTPFKRSGARTSLAVGCLVLSIVLAVGAYSHWRSVQQAMRRDAPLPGNILVPVLAVGAGVIALLAGAAVLLT